MKKIFMITVITSALVTGGLKAKFLWEASVFKAVATALVYEKINNKDKISKLNKKHSKEIKYLKNKYEKKIAKAKLRERAKAKVQRAVSAVPIMGIAAFGIFEKAEYSNWKKENPDGTFEEYTQEIGGEVSELLREEYREYYEDYQKFLSIYDGDL